jgi:hypothetical protein
MANERTSTETWFFGGLFALLVLGYMASRDDRGQPAPPPSAQNQEGEGRVLCRMAIKQAASNPSTVQFGAPQFGRKDGGMAYFWPLGGGLRMQNRLGAINDAQALCIVSGNPPRVVKLSIDGQSVIGQ